MRKSILLGIINLVLVCWFTLILAKSHYSFEPFVSLYSIIQAYASLLIILLLDLVNAYLAYVLLLKQPKKISYPIVTTVTFAPLFWFIFTFLGFFFASNRILPITGVLIAVTSYLYFRKYSHRLALFLLLGTLFVLSTILVSSFEEDYCWKQGIMADPTGGKFVRATKEDEKLLAWNNVKKGDEIGVAFRTHMLCHSTFNVWHALQKSYLKF